MKSNSKDTNIVSIVEQLYDNVKKIRYGSVGVTLKIHDGRITVITHSITENLRVVTEEE